MPTQAVPPLTPLPPPPDPNASDTFDERAFAFTTAQRDVFRPQIVALANNVKFNADEAAASMLAAANSALVNSDTVRLTPLTGVSTVAGNTLLASHTVLQAFGFLQKQIIDLNAAIKTLIFTPESLFPTGVQGAWYDSSDFSSMFQDVAGTIPVTAVGQAVARINDKSGRGNHATQASAPARPLLQIDAGSKFYLAFDGLDDNMATATINFTGTDKLTAFLGVHKNSDAAVGQVLELSASIATNAGAFSFPSSPNINDYGIGLSGSAGFTTLSSGAFPAPITSVLTGLLDINVASDKVKIRVNALQRAASGAAAIGSGNFGNYPMYLGSRAGNGLFFNGRMYSVIVRGAASTAAEITDAEKYVNSKTGAY